MNGPRAKNDEKSPEVHRFYAIYAVLEHTSVTFEAFHDRGMESIKGILCKKVEFVHQAQIFLSVLILPCNPHLKKAIGYGVHLCPAFYMISDHLKSQKMPYGILHRTWGLERMPLDKRNRSHFRCLYIFGYRNQSLFLGIIQQGQLCQE